MSDVVDSVKPRFAKRIVPECRGATRRFQGREGFVEQGHFNKHFVKNASKKLHNCNLNGKFNPKMDTIRAFLSKIRAFFSIFKKEQGHTVLTMPGLWDASGFNYVRVLNIAWLNMQELHRFLNMSAYGSIYLNNSWICLNMSWCASVCLNMA